MEFTKATKEKAKLRMALQGASGSGKTMSALKIAFGLGDRVAVVDTEYGSASKYADEFDFETLKINGNYHPKHAIDALALAAREKFDVCIIDSMTHFWNSTGGFLELVDAEVLRMKAKGNKPDSFAAWKAVTPIYNQLVQAILSADLHVIVTMRAKQSYEKEQDASGRTTIKKMGLAPEMRDNFQYEMDIEGMLDMEHNLSIGKTRCRALDGKVFHNPGKDVAAIIKEWLDDGVDPVQRRSSEPLSPDRAAFNDFVKPLLSEKRLNREMVEACLKDHGGDYAKAREYIEGLLKA